MAVTQFPTITSTEIINALGYTPARITPQSRTITAASGTITSGDNGYIIFGNRATAQTFTLSSTPDDIETGCNILVIQIGAGQITLVGDGVVINNRQSQTKTAGQYAVVSLIATDEDIFDLAGDTA